MKSSSSSGKTGGAAFRSSAGPAAIPIAPVSAAPHTTLDPTGQRVASQVMAQYGGKPAPQPSDADALVQSTMARILDPDSPAADDGTPAKPAGDAGSGDDEPDSIEYAP